MHDRLHIVAMSLATVYVVVLGVVMTSERQRDSRKLYRTYADPAPVHPALLAVTPWRAMISAVEGIVVSLSLVLQELPCCGCCGFGPVSLSRIQRPRIAIAKPCRCHCRIGKTIPRLQDSTKVRAYEISVEIIIRGAWSCVVGECIEKLFIIA